MCAIPQLVSAPLNPIPIAEHFRRMTSVITAVILKMDSTGDCNFDSMCPTIVKVYQFYLSLLGYASFLNITATAVDRLLAVFTLSSISRTCHFKTCPCGVRVFMFNEWCPYLHIYFTS